MTAPPYSNRDGHPVKTGQAVPKLVFFYTQKLKFG